MVVFMFGQFRLHPIATKKRAGRCSAPPWPPVGTHDREADVKDDTSIESESELGMSLLESKLELESDSDAGFHMELVEEAEMVGCDEGA